MRYARPSATLAAACLAGCLGTGAPALDAEALRAAQLEQGRRLAGVTLEVRGRLANLDLALTQASSEFCGQLSRPKLGATFGSSTSFSGVARQVAEESYLLGQEPTVAHVSPGGPLDRAQIQPGDRILSIEGNPVTTLDQLGELLEAHPLRMALTLARGDQTLERTVEPVATCPIKFDFALSPRLVPRPASKLGALIPLGLLNYLDDDGELAVVLGHQLAHLLFDRDGDSLSVREARADRLGLFVVARAGYDASVAPRVWEKLASETPYLIFDARSAEMDSFYPHSMLAQRMPGIRAAVQEVERLRSEGRPLVPTAK
jgi:hypothetical protein